jgi:hypothetical protein
MRITNAMARCIFMIYMTIVEVVNATVNFGCGWLLLKTPPYQTPLISESKIGLVLVDNLIGSRTPTVPGHKTSHSRLPPVCHRSE